MINLSTSASKTCLHMFISNAAVYCPCTNYQYKTDQVFMSIKLTIVNSSRYKYSQARILVSFYKFYKLPVTTETMLRKTHRS